MQSRLQLQTYQKVMDKETAREVWEELKRNFEASSKDQLFRIYEIVDPLTMLQKWANVPAAV